MISDPDTDTEDDDQGWAGSGWLGAIAEGEDSEQKTMVFVILGVPFLCVLCCCFYGVCCKKTGFENWSTDKAACKRFCTPRCSKEDCTDCIYRFKVKYGTHLTCASFSCPPAPWTKVPGDPICPPSGCTKELCCVCLTTTPCTTSTHLTCASFTCPPAPWTKVPGDPVCPASGC